MKKVIHLITSTDKGGAETQVVNLANLQQRKTKYNIKIIYSKGDGYWHKKNKNRNITFVKLRENYLSKIIYFKILKDIISIYKIIKNFRPDVVHVHLPYMEICIFFVSLLIKKNFKLICTKHLDNNIFDNIHRSTPKFLANSITKIISNKFDKIIAISNAVKKFYLRNNLVGKKSKLVQIYYGIEFQKKLNKKTFKKIDLRNKYNINKETFLIGTISRLVYQKSLEDLIDAFSIYKKKNKDSKLVIVGKGPLKEKLKNRALNLGITKEIVWIDFIDDIKPFFYSIDLFVLCSKYEGLGLALLESLSFGKPIVATSSGAIPEVIINNFNGRLVKRGRPKLLARAFNKIPIKKFKKNGYKILKKKFNNQDLLLKTNKVYN